MAYKPETIEVAHHTGTDVPCGIARATCLPRVLSVGGIGFSTARILSLTKEVLESSSPSDHPSIDVVLDDLDLMLRAVK
jgi:hypothetical protein